MRSADLSAMARHTNSVVYIIRRLEYITNAIREMAIECTYHDDEVLLTFPPTLARRVAILNELCAVWGATMYAETPLAGRAYVQTGVVFPRRCLRNGSPDQMNLNAAIVRALAVIARL
jgi:hypothetical protein